MTIRIAADSHRVLRPLSGWHWTCLLLLCVLWAAPPAALALNVSSSDGAEKPVDLTPEAALMMAGPGVVVDDVLTGRHDTQFRPFDEEALGQCSAVNVCWLRVTLARDMNTRPIWMLRARATQSQADLQGLALYERKASFEIMPARYGEQYTILWRIGSVDLVFPLELHDSPSTYYLRVQRPLTEASLALWQEQGFEKLLRHHLFFVSTSFGMSLMLAMINLMLWRWLKDALYMQFALIMISALFLHVWHVAQLLDGTRGPPNLELRGAAQALFHAAVSLFFITLFEVRRHARWLQRLGQFVIAVNLVAVAFAVLGYYHVIQQGLALFMVTCAAIGMGMIWWIGIVRQRDLLLVALFATSPLILTIVARLELFRGPALQNHDSLDPLAVIVRVTYLLLLGVIIVRRIKSAEQTARAARRREREASLKAAQELEAKVEQRTHELAQSNELLHQEIDNRRTAEINLKSALEAERKAMLQQRQFVAMASHEFRTPLALIDAAAGSMELNAYHPQAQTSLGRIRRAVGRLSGLIENFLTEDRLLSSEVQSKNERFNVQDVLQRLPLSTGVHTERRLRIQPARGRTEMMGDVSLVEVAVQNLVQNALKYSPADRPVTVSAYAADGWIHVDVADEGPGIPVQEQGSIFEKFQRGTTSAGIGGTGLGLHLALNIARRHGGDVKVLSSNDRGSVFRLRLRTTSSDEDADRS